jgi:beta-fructofuranosidase
VDELDAAHRSVLARADASVAAAAARAAEDPSRPIYHLTSPAHWINDPNGPVYYDGEYHLFFQHNPFGSEWGRMFWGHAVSLDLVHWEHLPIALAPNPGSYDKDGVFSGCCVVHEGVPTILYTGVSPECQCIATSGDRLRSWVKHPSNPVIATPPRDDLEGFRDPFCWREGKWWYMALGSRIRGEGGCVLLYRSADLRQWVYLGPLYRGATDMMECPNFFALGGKWLLCVSPCAPVIYAMGTFAKHRFHPETEWLPMDLGGREDFYAPNSMLDAQGRRIQWGWVRVGPPGASWNGVLTLPRVLGLRTDGQLGIEPLPELSRLRGPHERWEDIALAADAPARLTRLRSDTVEISAELELGSARELELTLGRASFGRSPLTLTHDREAGRLHCAQRSGTFRVLPGERGLQLRIFLDRSVMEVYVNGRVALTAGGDQLESRGEAHGGEGEWALTLLARGGPARASAVDVWEMGSIWGAQRHETGDCPTA